MNFSDIVSTANARPWTIAFLVIVLYFVGSAIYSLYFSPLASYPGPFFAKISAFPNFYHAYTGYRHIWIWRCHQQYGEAFRFKPNGVLFNTPTAFKAIHNTKAPIKKSKFYEMWPRNQQNHNTLSMIDRTSHARKRKVLNQAFSESSLRSAEKFVIKHIDRWCELLLDDNDGKEWTKAVNMAEWGNKLTFDIMAELCFGKSMDIKEPGENSLKKMPKIIGEYLRFMYPISHSPFVPIWVWLKPRGLDYLFELVVPADIKVFYNFLETSVDTRRLEEEALEKSGSEQDEKRKDMFHYLFKTRNEDGSPAYSKDELLAEADLLVIAGSDTTAIALSAFWFYIVRRSYCYGKLVKEIRDTFASAADIKSGPQLAGCKYLQASINEALRLGPAGGSEGGRVVLPGGFTIPSSTNSSFSTRQIPAGTEVGVAFWALNHHEPSYGDPWIFRPERWIVDPSHGVGEEDVERAKEAFNPFLIGAGNCVGQKLAMNELLMTVARMLWVMDVRLKASDMTGGGKEELGWGCRDPNHFNLQDFYVSQRDGPMVELRRRIV